MGLFSRRRKPAIETRSSSSTDPDFWPLLGAAPSATGMMISQQTAMSVSAVYACVTIRSEDTARCRPALWKPAPDGSRVEVKDHPVAKLLKRPNDVQTWNEFCLQMEAACLLRGNAYAAIKRDPRGKPLQLIPINPDAVTVMEAPDGSIFYSVSRIGYWQIAMLSEFPTWIPAEDIFHLRGLSFNALVAASTIYLAKDAIGLSMGFEQQSARWMKNGARPSIVLETLKTLSNDAAERLKKSWNSLFGGIQNTGQTAVLEEGLTAKILNLTAEDLEFLAQRQNQVEEIARFYRVPPHKLAKTDGLRGLNLPQADQ